MNFFSKIFLLVLLAISPAWAVPIVVTDGSRGGGIDLPWEAAGSAMFSSVRYQQSFSSAFFISNGVTSPFTITALAYDNRGDSHSTLLSNVTITLSTINSGLSTTFASNVGSDVTTVYSGDLTLASSGGLFDTVVTLQNPFVYDPGMGDLVVDVTNPNDVGMPIFSNSGLVNPTRVFNNIGPASGFQDSLGLATQFRGTIGEDVPEINAASAALPLGICLLLGFLVSDPRRAKQEQILRESCVKG